MSTLIFESAKQLTAITSDPMKFASILGSTSCLAMILETDDTGEASFLIDFLHNVRMESKYFFLQVNSVMDPDLLSNKTINFDVIISNSQSEGKDHILSKIYEVKLRSLFWIYDRHSKTKKR